MDRSDKTFFNLLKERYNRESLSKIFKFGAAMFFSLLIVLLFVGKFIENISAMTEWFESIKGKTGEVRFSFSDMTFYYKNVVMQGDMLYSEYSAFGLYDTLLETAMNFLAVLPLIILIPLALRKIKKISGSIIHTEEDADIAAKEIIKRNRLAAAAQVVMILQVIYMSLTIAVRWDGIYAGMDKGRIELIDRHDLGVLYFTIATVLYILALASSVIVLNISNKILSDKVDVGRSKSLSVAEIAAKIFNISFIVVIFSACFFIGSTNTVSLSSAFDYFMPILYAAAVGGVALLLNSYRSGLAKNCASIAAEREIGPA